MYAYHVHATEALQKLSGALVEAEAILPASIRARYHQIKHAKGVNEWFQVAAWYQTQSGWSRPVANILTDLVLLSDAKAKLVTAVQGEPVHEPDISLPRTRRSSQ